jgi:hypothetical protein
LPADNDRPCGPFLRLKGIALYHSIRFRVRDNLDNLSGLELRDRFRKFGGNVGINAHRMLGKITAIGTDYAI